MSRIRNFCEGYYELKALGIERWSKGVAEGENVCGFMDGDGLITGQGKAMATIRSFEGSVDEWGG